MKRRRGNDYLEQRKQRAQQAKARSPETKPISEMSSEELDREIQRLKAEDRRLAALELEAERDMTSNRRMLFKRSRPAWK
jgi:hypothetical protein